MKKAAKKMPFKYWMIIIYAAIIAVSALYFIYLQKFGFSGLKFSLGGRNHVFDFVDIAIGLTTIIAFFLFAVSIMAFKRRGDFKMFVISVAFFLFAVKEVLSGLYNFFPEEFIFVSSAQNILDMLILVSFIFLIYKK